MSGGSTHYAPSGSVAWIRGLNPLPKWILWLRVEESSRRRTNRMLWICLHVTANYLQFGSYDTDICVNTFHLSCIHYWIRFVVKDALRCTTSQQKSDVIIGHIHTFLCLREWSCTSHLGSGGSTSPIGSYFFSSSFFFFFLTSSICNLGHICSLQFKCICINSEHHLLLLIIVIYFCNICFHRIHLMVMVFAYRIHYFSVCNVFHQVIY